MPFNRRFDRDLNEYVIDRSLTGPPRPNPSTGTIQSEDGTIVASSPIVVVPPATPVQVDLPGPNEPLIDARGMITPRWWRFIDQLYRRTGGIEDNINRVATTLLGTGGSGTLTLTGIAPTAEIVHNKAISGASLTLTGAAPTISVA